VPFNIHGVGHLQQLPRCLQQQSGSVCTQFGVAPQYAALWSKLKRSQLPGGQHNRLGAITESELHLH
jgi:hypothetical protein